MTPYDGFYKDEISTLGGRSIMGRLVLPEFFEFHCQYTLSYF